MLKNCSPSDGNAGNISCKLYISCPQQQEIIQLQQQVEQLQKQLKDFQNKTENQMGYCFANLNRLSIPTDPDSLEAYNEYSCGNHYNW